ncbi:MAG: hypothetical protein NTU93_00010 [Arthrobacter sp.]|nr:hypothetical protein [Arthrobacter sp.]
MDVLPGASAVIDFAALAAEVSFDETELFVDATAFGAVAFLTEVPALTFDFLIAIVYHLPSIFSA